MTARSSLTILFESPFWVGIYERMDGELYEVCKITFGAEPRDYEVLDYILNNWSNLKFSPPMKADKIEDRKINPKRMQREINNQLQNKWIGTKAQQALQLQREQNKTDRKVMRKKLQDSERDRKFAIKQEKKKSKHRGR